MRVKFGGSRSQTHELAKFSRLVFVSKNRLYQRPRDHDLVLDIVLDLVAALWEYLS